MTVDSVIPPRFSKNGLTMSTSHDHARWQAAAPRAPSPPRRATSPSSRPAGRSSRPTSRAAREHAPATAEVTPIQRTDLATGGTEHGLRVWDAASAAIRSFDRIDAYDYDPAWVVSGPLRAGRRGPHGAVRAHPRQRRHPRPRRARRHPRHGATAPTTPSRAFDDGGTLLLVFGDATNGAETYGAGRFLFVQREADAAAGEPGDVVLDFNRAFVPPCGFSAQYNCPLPPVANRFPLPIRAGEKTVVFRDGFDIYAA